MNTSVFKIWTKEEESELLNEFKKIPINEIANKHNRSIKAIEIRLQDIAVRMEQDGISIEEIVESTGVSKEIILSRKQSKEKEKKEKYNTSELKEIQLELKEIKLEMKELKLLIKELINSN